MAADVNAFFMFFWCFVQYFCGSSLKIYLFISYAFLNE